MVPETDSENEPAKIDFDYDNNDYNEESLSRDLSGWVNESQVKHNAVDKLLKILQQHGHGSLPSTARTLLKTKRTITTSLKSGMEYLYYPFSDQLLRALDKYPKEVTEHLDSIEISFNIDGLPLFKSSSKTVWPILCAVHLSPVSIFPIAITYGNSKPNDLDFLNDTLRETKVLMETGLQYQDKNIKIQIRCIVCDAPAKAMVKGIKLYSGYYGCDRCEQKGNWYGRLTYQKTENLPLRTNESFRRKTNPEHHHTDTPFCTLQIDMIRTFPIDYMHQCCLGVMKRLILLWLRGPKTSKMSASQAEQVNNKLHEMQKCIPSVFARKPRGLNEIERWKATEYRQFMLYTGKIVLKGILRDELYEHFMAFSVAICIISSRNLVLSYHQYAQDLLKYFVEKGRILYGPEFIVYNVHSLLHITDDAVMFGCLDNISAFPFENYLQKLKRMVRSGKQPLVQMAKRLDELECVRIKREEENSNKVSTSKPNNAYVMSTGLCCEVVSITNFEDEENNKKVMCRVYTCEPLQIDPCDLSIIGAYKTRERDSRMKLLSPSLLADKAIMLNKENGSVVFIALLHDF